MMNKKAYLQISFSWIFAIIVGAFILFLAIFFVTKFSSTERMSSEAETAKEIGVLLNPLETSFEQGRSSFLKTSVETRIYSRCSTEQDFGYQGILVKEKIYNKWTESNVSVNFQNKYIFSENPVQGNNFYLFSKPFVYPFEIASLIYLIPENKVYCFSDPPQDIEEEIQNLNIETLKINSCEPEDIKVCFDSLPTSCDIIVDSNKKYVKKDSEIYYIGKNQALMFAAIFSDKTLYDCQVQRLMMRAKVLSDLYKDKLILPSYGSCSSYLSNDLNTFSTLAQNFNASLQNDFLAIYSIQDKLYTKNKYSTCTIW